MSVLPKWPVDEGDIIVAMLLALVVLLWLI